MSRCPSSRKAARSNALRGSLHTRVTLPTTYFDDLPASGRVSIFVLPDSQSVREDMVTRAIMPAKTVQPYMDIDSRVAKSARHLILVRMFTEWYERAKTTKMIE